MISLIYDTIKITNLVKLYNGKITLIKINTWNFFLNNNNNKRKNLIVPDKSLKQLSL